MKNMMKKLVAFLLVLATFATTQLSTIVFAGTIDEDTSVEILKEVENEDGTLLVTIRDSQGVHTIKYYLSDELNADARLSWKGWGSPSTSYYDATAEQTLHSMTKTIMAAFLTAKFGVIASVAAGIAQNLIDAATNSQKTVWLGRKTWFRTDYTAYRRQDTYYSDSSYKKVMYTDSIREYFTGN